MTDTPTPGRETDAVDILTADHRSMLELLGQVEGETDPQRRRDLADTVIAEVVRHSVAEEMYVYPAMEKHLPNGPEEVEHDKKEHDEIVQVMKALEDVDAATPRFMELVRDLEGQLRHHVDDEESDQFPRLRAGIPADELVELGRKVEKAKTAAPTRPHPHAPHSELFHKTIGPGVGMVDRLRDRLSGRSTG
ncbi:hemerythrin domain-containing protein [Citricoccus sp. SGAir0253]|uniref:hemerythrin domain-containing protein n=1 Tax=Citricoccus sp. SGAir0253 TaxID=2567881 RepID=UPI0010CD5F02|nr:hemerythrin domain-containing protein [Citricoccus sp. SGAir0253]QCU79164.1 hemerythrin domain-containing protein [Citricoccus sp. SGAir0253]